MPLAEIGSDIIHQATPFPVAIGTVIELPFVERAIPGGSKTIGAVLQAD